MSRLTRWVFEANGQAVVGAVVGTFALVFFGIVLGPTATVLGLLARARIAETGEPGRGIAIYAIAVGVVAFVLAIVLAVV